MEGSFPPVPGTASNRRNTMGIISSGFRGRRNKDQPGLPPGQYLTEGFPVLSAGPTPRITTAEWEFKLTTESGDVRSWSWEEFQNLPQEEFTVDIHCVTSWSKFGTRWKGVALDTFFQDVKTSYDYTMFSSYGGYTTNLPMEDILGGKAWVVHQFDGDDLAPAHGGPARLLVPHLYFWKSAKWVRGVNMMQRNDPGFWESNGYNLHADPWLEERYW
jgi:DMSO/TMAO reductase YedYZ molybdopterin-dependent catalytic subunit